MLYGPVHTILSTSPTRSKPLSLYLDVESLYPPSSVDDRGYAAAKRSPGETYFAAVVSCMCIDAVKASIIPFVSFTMMFRGQILFGAFSCD